jgi:Asp-tRNA(Asn)/Glu-tRNA(Gln) amidotransferase A subunit family amidase
MRTIGDYREAYRSGKRSPRDVADFVLSTIERLDGEMRWFIAVHGEDVRTQAGESAARHAAKRPLSALDGVPVAVKDEYDVTGYGTTCGTSFLGKTPATSDALTVARLKRAGAIIVGKTNMHELGVNPSGINIHHGAAKNPWDPTRDTGGSSSGSGAVVGAGLVPLALGNDGGGSIRIPAALCGAVGHKATYGRVPTDGVAVLCWSLEHSGPIAATVEDARLAMHVLCDEPAELPPALPLTVGICDSWWAGASPEVAAVTHAAVERLATAGAKIVRVELPYIEYATPVGAATFLAEGAACIEQHLNQDAPLAPSVKMSFLAATGMTAPQFVKAARVRALIARSFDAAFERCDVLITPTTGITAPPYLADALAYGEVDEAKVNRLVHFTFPLNLTGLPAVSVPCGFDPTGLPVGMQIIARRGDDFRALAVAALVEKDTPRKAPAIILDPLS